MNQVAKGNAHKIRCDPTIRLDIHKIRITASVWIFLKPKNETEKRAKQEPSSLTLAYQTRYTTSSTGEGGGEVRSLVSLH